MAPLPANNTGRVFVDYITGADNNSKEHTISWRYASPDGSVDSAQQGLQGFLGSLGTAQLATGWRVLRAREQAAGEDFTFPVDVLPGLAAIVGTGGAMPNPYREAMEMTWQARSRTSGRRLDFSLYGLVVQPPDNFRLIIGDYPWVMSTLVWLNGTPLSGTKPVCIDGSDPVWYSYVNSNFNSYWEGRIRTV